MTKEAVSRPIVPAASEGRRRTFSEEDKRRIVEQAARPGANLFGGGAELRDSRAGQKWTLTIHQSPTTHEFGSGTAGQGGDCPAVSEGSILSVQDSFAVLIVPQRRRGCTLSSREGCQRP